MRSSLVLVSATVIGLLMAVTQSPAAEGPKVEKSKLHTEKMQAAAQAVYCCPDCHTMALKEEKCPTCGKEMQKSHLLGTKGGEAMLCACGTDCKCDAKGMKDGKCACGKDVMKVSAKGMYACPMGCPVLSAKAEKCPHCGMEMKKVE